MINDSLFSFYKKVPFYYQNKNSDCALTCIRMISEYHGIFNKLNDINTNIISSFSVHDIVSTISSLGMTSRPVSLEIDEVDKLNLPCILHWDMNHFVVLVKIKRGKYTIHDPERGIRVLSRKKMSASFTGVAIEVYKASAFDSPSSKKKSSFFPYIWNIISSGKKNFIYLSILVLIIEAVSITLPQITQMVIDNIILNRDYQLLLSAILLYFILNLVNISVIAFRDWIILWINSNINIQWSLRSYNHLISLKTSYFSSRGIGDILSRVGSLESIRNILVSKVISVFLDLFMASAALILMFTYNSVLTIIVLITIIIYLAFKLIYFNSLRMLNLGTIRIKSRQQSTLIEAVKKNQTIKLYFNEYIKSGKYEECVIDSINTNVNIEKYKILLNSVNILLSGLKSIAVIYYGSMCVINGSFTIGMLVAFISYSEQLNRRSINIIDFIIQIGFTKTHTQRVADLLSAPREGITLSKSCFDESIPRITLNNVSCQYSGSNKMAICNINFTVNPGDTVLLTGISGSGKSTIISAILGLIDLSSGYISVEAGVHSYNIEETRRITGSVLQGDSLLSGTILYNITFSDKKPSTELFNLTTELGIHDLIQNLPMGYYTIINDAGSFLSAGQVQKILLARALYRKPRILILDEATSNLDSHSENIINKLILSLNCTKIIISHKPEAFSVANKIVHIENGRIKSIKLSIQSP